jgi:hypothetical protein
MAIRCQRIGQPQLAHHHETAAIGEGIRVVGMLSEKALVWSLPLGVAINPVDFQ